MDNPLLHCLCSCSIEDVEQFKEYVINLNKINMDHTQYANYYDDDDYFIDPQIAIQIIKKFEKLQNMAKDLVHSLIDDRAQSLDVVLVKLYLIFSKYNKYFNHYHYNHNMSDYSIFNQSMHSFTKLICYFPVWTIFCHDYNNDDNHNHHEIDQDISHYFKSNILHQLNSKKLYFSICNSTYIALMETCNHFCNANILLLISQFTNFYGFHYFKLASHLITEIFRNDRNEDPPMWFDIIYAAYHKNLYIDDLIQPLCSIIIPSTIICHSLEVNDAKLLFEGELIYISILRDLPQPNDGWINKYKTMRQKINKYCHFKCIKSAKDWLDLMQCVGYDMTNFFNTYCQLKIGNLTYAEDIDLFNVKYIGIKRNNIKDIFEFIIKPYIILKQGNEHCLIGIVYKIIEAIERVFYGSGCSNYQNEIENRKNDIMHPFMEYAYIYLNNNDIFDKIKYNTDGELIKVTFKLFEKLMERHKNEMDENHINITNFKKFMLNLYAYCNEGEERDSNFKPNKKQRIE